MSSVVAIVASGIAAVIGSSVERSAAIVVASRIPISGAVVERKSPAAGAITWSVAVAWRACGGIGIIASVRIDLHTEINGLYFYFRCVNRRKQ